MGIFGVTISGQSIIGVTKSSTNNINYTNPIKNPLQLHKSKKGSNYIGIKTKKISSFSIVKASTEGTNTGSMSTTIQKAGVIIERDPPESRLSQLGVRQWPKWGCAPSKFPWTYDAKETCYLLKGKVKVYPDGSDEAVEFGAGDLVVFPKGMKCTWDVSEAVDKHYNFE